MKTIPTLLAALALITSSASLAQITIGNVRAAQRPGTKLVDIDYDLTGIATPWNPTSPATAAPSPASTPSAPSPTATSAR